MTDVARLTISFRRDEGVYYVVGPAGTLGPYATRTVAVVVAFVLEAMLDAWNEVQRRERALTEEAQKNLREHFDRILQEMAGSVARLTADPGEGPLFVEEDAPTPAPTKSRSRGRS